MIGPWSNKQGDPMTRRLLKSTLCLRTKKYLLIVAICLSCCAINGCVDSINYLASYSRLPKWFTLPPGLTRADVIVIRASMEPTRGGEDIKVALIDRKYKTLAEVSGKSIRLGNFVLNVVDGVPEITGYKAEIDEHGDRMPYFYVVDDPAFKKKLLDENGIDDPTLRKRLLEGPPMCPKNEMKEADLSQNSEGGPCLIDPDDGHLGQAPNSPSH
jgi:hypothetical protein